VKIVTKLLLPGFAHGAHIWEAGPPVRGGAGEMWAPMPHVRKARAILEPVFDAWAGDLRRKRF
jgi:hypothetical protein